MPMSKILRRGYSHFAWLEIIFADNTCSSQVGAWSRIPCIKKPKLKAVAAEVASIPGHSEGPGSGVTSFTAKTW